MATTPHHPSNNNNNNNNNTETTTPLVLFQVKPIDFPATGILFTSDLYLLFAVHL
jgi:hypothetical protein